MNLLPILHQKLLFTTEDIAREIGNSQSAATMLWRYQRQGYISQVRRGLYCVNNMATQQPEANKFQIASAITPTSYVAYHAAMEYHGLAHQVYYDVVVGTKQTFKAFEFYNYRYAPHRSACSLEIETPIADTHIRVTSVERTILDCIDRIDLCGGWEELVNCLRSVTYLQEERLKSTLEAYSKTALYKKVGFLFEQLQVPASQNFIADCRKYAKDSVMYLTSDGTSDTFYASWRLYAPHNLLTINNQNADELV